MIYTVASQAPEVRAARERWRKRLEEGGVVSWDQSSEDVHVAVQLPGNTTARGVKARHAWLMAVTRWLAAFARALPTTDSAAQVEIAPKRLSVKLDWHGAVLEGELAHGIKAREATWSLEGSEIIILLPKDDKERVWRSLIKGKGDGRAGGPAGRAWRASKMSHPDRL